MMKQRANVKFCVKYGKTFTEITDVTVAYITTGDKALWATYKTPEFSVEKLRRTNTKKVCLQKSKVKIMLIIFYDSNRIIHKEFISQDY